MNRRGHRRYEVGLPCTIFSIGSGGWLAAGRTVNISRSGMLIERDRSEDSPEAGAIPPHSAVRVDLELPNDFDAHRRVLSCMGTVVENRPAPGSRTLLAIAINHMRIEDLPPGLMGLLNSQNAPEGTVN